MFIVNHRKIFFSISAILVALSLFSIFNFGLKLGVDFTGGSILEITYKNSIPEQGEVLKTVESSGVEQVVVRQAGEDGYIIKTEVITDAQKNIILENLTSESLESNEISVERFNTVGPTLGDELKTKASIALVVLIIVIIFFIAYTFRHVSKPVSSWKYGFTAIIALIHDVLITLGVFTFLGGVYGIEIDTLFVTALLVILGYSINDTIVVLDRVRENLRDQKDEVKEKNFDTFVGRSLNETFSRSINTSITTLLALLALYFIGGIATQTFALALIIGVIAGSYSSLFLAAPLLVVFKNKQKAKKEVDA